MGAFVEPRHRRSVSIGDAASVLELAAAEVETATAEEENDEDDDEDGVHDDREYSNVHAAPDEDA